MFNGCRYKMILIWGDLEKNDDIELDLVADPLMTDDEGPKIQCGRSLW